MHKAQEHKDTNPLPPRVIAISSGKGGVGKSSISVNLGISLVKSGARVCLLDADTGLANANILLGLTPQFSLEHVLYGAKPIEEVMLDGPHGLKVVPGAHGISECVDLHPRQQMRLTRELARIEKDFDYILIDTAAGISETTLDFVSAAHYTLIVITPEPTSLTDAFSLIKLLKRRRNTANYQVVVNMCRNAAQAKEVYHRFSSAVAKYIDLETHMLGYILRDESMRAAVVLQNPVAMFPDTDPSCRGFIKLAEALETVVAESPVKTSFSAYWQRRFRKQRGGSGESGEASVPVAEIADSRSRDDDYLAELRSRLLLVVEQGQQDASRIRGVLQECTESFIHRFGQSPLDVLWHVEKLVQSPDRDDQLLREIADRVKPWGGFANVLPVGELSDEDLDSFIDFQSIPETLPERVNEPGVQQPPFIEPHEVGADVARGEPETGEVSFRVRPGAAVECLHHYDAGRFGSQENLLDLLKRTDSSQQTLAEFLENLV